MRAISPNLDWSYDRDDHYLADLAAFGPFYRSAGWPDAHIPRTEEPVRFNGPHGCTFKDGHHESYPSFVDRCPI